MPKNQLISFYIIACNQERFITEAISGAFMQSYTPLEIILSDDCSDDGTFLIMEKMFAEYRGPHKIIINRNSKRLGIGAHINLVVSMSTGNWIVASAGDDVSLPERTEKLYNYWKENGEMAGLVFSELIEMNEDGSDRNVTSFRNNIPNKELNWNYLTRLSGRQIPVHGASFAYPKRLFDDFGPLYDGVIFEDNILNWRAEVAGGVMLYAEPLVRHRNHSGQITNLYSPQALMDADNRRRKLRMSDLVTREQNISDTVIAFKKGWISPAEYEVALNNQKRALIQEQSDFDFQWGSFTKRWKLLFNKSILRKKKPMQIFFAALPRPLYLAGLRMLVKLRGAFRTFTAVLR